MAVQFVADRMVDRD